MTFEEMFERQARTQGFLGDDLLSEEQRIARINALSVLSFIELGDMLVQLGLKRHHPFRESNKLNALHEYVDFLKYAIAIGCVAGFDPNDIDSLFREKSDSVDARLLRDALSLEQQPVAVFDIDGVLCAHNEYQDYEIADGVFRDCIPNIAVCDLTRTLNEYGFRVVIVTSRKDYKWRNVTTDTEMWLASNNVHCDRLIFSYDKAHSVSDMNVVFAVEDSDKHAAAYADDGITTFLYPSSRNASIWERVDGLTIDSLIDSGSLVVPCDDIDFIKRFAKTAMVRAAFSAT